MTSANPLEISFCSRILGTGLCVALAVGACFAEGSSLATVREEAVVTSTETQTGAETENQDQPSELSVPPLDHKIYPDDRPSWISEDPQLDGQRHRWPVVSVPSLTPEASRESLQMRIQLAVEAYVNQWAGSEQAGEAIRFDEAYIDAHLVNPSRHYSGVVTTSNGEMYEDATELVFDADFRDEVDRQWREHEVAERLAGLGLLGAGGVVLLMGLTSVLKFVNRVVA